MLEVVVGPRTRETTTGWLSQSAYLHHSTDHFIQKPFTSISTLPLEHLGRMAYVAVESDDVCIFHRVSVPFRQFSVVPSEWRTRGSSTTVRRRCTSRFDQLDNFQPIAFLPEENAPTQTTRAQGVNASRGLGHCIYTPGSMLTHMDYEAYIQDGAKTSTSFWNIEYYQTHFDVDTQTVRASSIYRSHSSSCRARYRSSLAV